jgi:aldehyde:ferredoxin oxidoreductase
MAGKKLNGGYMGKILRVDLSAGKITSETLAPEFLSEYIGGSGLAVRLLYDENQPGIDPYSPDNRIIFATGPLTGTLVPGSGTYAVVSRNTLTGLTACCQSNGFWGARLKYAGYDAIIIQGCSENLVYLNINDGSATIEDASDLAGKGAFVTERDLKKKYGEDGLDSRISVAAIGPAGENLVRFACIENDFGHIAATGGLGAVMGSKKLKAIVVQGKQPIPIGDDRVEAFLGHLKQWRTEANNSGMGKTIGKLGSIGLFSNYHKNGWVPVKNLTTNVFPGTERFDANYIRDKVYRSVPKACCTCTYYHCHSVQVKKGPYKGVVGEEVEYEILAGFGPNWGIYDPGAVTMLNTLNDDLGMDAKEVSFVLSMMMEGYDKGFIKRKDLDGIDLRWGDPEAAAAALRAISTRRGIGNVLAEGVMRTAETLGGEFPQMAVFVKKGNAPHIHDSRTRWGTLFNQIVSDMGSQEGLDLTGRGSTDLGISQPTSQPDEYLGRVNAQTEWLRQFEECLMYCYYQTPTLKTMIETLNCVTGSEYSREDALAVGRRVVNLLRMFNLREGMTVEHDSFSPRLAAPPVDGPNIGKSLAPTFEKVRGAYYDASGWDEKGMPRPELLKSLQLAFAVDVLNK